MKLEGKAFIITGGAGSIGGSIAREVIAKGGIAIIFDILEEVAGKEKVSSYHTDRALYYKTDISDLGSVQTACEEALKAIPKGSLFGGVHCAAIAPGKKWTHKLTEKDFARVMQVNATGTFIVNSCIAESINSQYADEGPFAARTKEERGCIVNIASIVAHPVPARCISYGPSKSAVLGISQGMADFLGPFGIRVNAVSPSIVASGLMGPDRLPYFQAEMDAAAIFPRRVSQPEEVAHAVLYLMENSMMNDCEIRVDGGWRGSSNWGGPKDPRSNAISLE